MVNFSQSFVNTSIFLIIYSVLLSNFVLCICRLISNLLKFMSILLYIKAKCHKNECPHDFSTETGVFVNTSGLQKLADILQVCCSVNKRIIFLSCLAVACFGVYHVCLLQKFKKETLIPHNSPFIPKIPKTVLENGKVLFTIWRQKVKFYGKPWYFYVS